MIQSRKKILTIVILLSVIVSSCVSKKQLSQIQSNHEKEMAVANEQLGKCGAELSKYMEQSATFKSQNEKLNVEIKGLEKVVSLKQEQIEDLKKQREQQVTQVGDLTVLSQSASNNIKETLQQLEKKDKYIQLVQAARTKADSINLALAVNLKSVLENGVDDEDIEVKVDKTVVFINISDKMLFQSGSSLLTPKAYKVLEKISKIIQSRPELEVMVEGYTDNDPISNSCIADNWDLSVKRSTSVVRTLQKNYQINPNRLIAAGRGEYNALASNDTSAGKAMNRRTRIILLPKLGEFYDLLNPNNVTID
ncbi:MAG: flagellar motor protein MotB [Saprospiraceae bacterium]